MAKDQTVQSLDRGIAILRLLARQECVTASAIAERIGVHQSSASRLLNSLHKAGFVKKPDFHRFALDYGALIFAGEALSCFPAVTAAVTVCNQIATQTAWNASVAILRDNRLLYFTQVHSAHDSSLRLINDSDFPIHQSSHGMVLSHERGESEAVRILTASIEQADDQDASATAIYAATDRSIQQKGFLYLDHRHRNRNRFNAAMPFTLDGEAAALAIYSQTKNATGEELRPLLRESIERIITQFCTVRGKSLSPRA